MERGINATVSSEFKATIDKTARNMIDLGRAFHYYTYEMAGLHVIEVADPQDAEDLMLCFHAAIREVGK